MKLFRCAGSGDFTVFVFRFVVTFSFSFLVILLCPPETFSESENSDAAESMRPNSSVNDTPLYIDEKIELERKQVQEIPLQGLQRSLIMDPSVASVSQNPNTNQIIVQGISFGQTYLHLWTEEGRKSIQIKVVPALKKKENAKSKKGQGMKIVHGLTSVVQTARDYKTRRDSKNYSYNYMFSAAGKTPLGETRTAVNYENRNDFKRISSLRTEFKNKTGEFKAGDLNPFASQLTLPLISFQGVQWSSPESKMFTVDFMGGNTDNRFWGGSYGGVQYKQPENSFVGLKTAFKPVENLELFAAGSKTLNRAYPERAENKGLGSKWRIGSFTLQSEASLSATGKAWYGDLQYRRKHAYCVVSQRSVDKGYVTANGGAWARGEAGQTGQIGLNDIGLISLAEWSLNQFRTDVQPSKSQPYSLNREWKGRVEIRQSIAELSQEIVLQDFPGVSGASRTNLCKTKLATLEEPFQIHASFRREWGDSLEDSKRGYSESGIGYGLKIEPAKFASCAVSLESVWSHNLYSGDERSFVNLNAGLRLQGSLGFRSLKHSLSVDYHEMTQRFSDASRSLSAQLRTDCLVGKNFQIYAVGQVQNNMSSQNLGHAIEVNTGIQWSHDLGLFGLRSRKVKGYVFKDLNGDGIRQKNEPGIKGVKLILNDSKIAVTDSNGKFSFSSSKGVLSVRLDKNTIPANMRLSSSNPQLFSESMDEATLFALFGVAYLGEVRGKICMDRNDNGRLDLDDKPIGQALLSLDNGEQTTTDMNGEFLFAGVSPGSHQVRLNIMTLPPDMVSLTPTGPKFELAEGESKEISFLMRPVRSISGTVFWDKNGSGTLDEGETAVQDIVLSAGESLDKSDRQGRYYLNRFAGGKLMLNILKDSLGKKWRVEKNFQQLFDVPPDQPFIVRNLDIPVQKRQPSR